MSNRDQQLDDALKQALGALDIPPGSDEAKRRAIAMARTEFEQVQQEKVIEFVKSKIDIKSESVDLEKFKKIVQN